MDRKHTTNETTSESEVTCYQCGQRGHIKPDCQTKRKFKRKAAVIKAEAYIAQHGE